MPYKDAVKHLSGATGRSKEDLDEMNKKGRFFNWWYRIPLPAEKNTIDLTSYEIMPDESFWAIVKIIDWNKSKKNDLSKKAKKHLDKLSDAKKTALNNAYAIRMQLLSMVLNSYVIATSNSPKTSDDGTWDLLAEVIGRGEEFFMACISDPSQIVKIANDENFYENFGYELPVVDNIDKVANWGNHAYGDDGNLHAVYSSWMVRQFQCLYGII